MDRLAEVVGSPYTALCAAVLLGGLAMSGRFSGIAAVWMIGLAWLIAVIGIFRSTPIQGLPWLPRALWMALVASALSIPAFYLGQWARADLRVSPERMKIWPNRPFNPVPLRIANRRDRDLERKAVLVRFTPSLPTIADADFVPPRRAHPVTGKPTMDERIRIVRWEEEGATCVLFLVEYVYAADSIEYQVVIDTDRFTSPVEMTAAEVDPARYQSRDIPVAFEGDPNERMVRTFPERIAQLAASPQGWVMLVVGDGSWRTATRTYGDLIPATERDGFRVHLYRDFDDHLKLELRTRWYAGGVLAFPISKLPGGHVHAIAFGWSPKGMIMKIDLLPSVKLGDME